MRSIVSIKIGVLASLLSITCYCQSQDDFASQVDSNLMTSFVIKGRSLPAYSITERMTFHKIPGLSIAFIEDGQIKWTITPTFGTQWQDS